MRTPAIDLSSTSIDSRQAKAQTVLGSYKLWQHLSVVQRSEEAGAQFRKWLKALSDHSRNLLGAKAAMAAAEATVKARLRHSPP